MEVAEVIFYELPADIIESVKEKFDAYETPGIKSFFVDQADNSLSREAMLDFFLPLGIDECEIDELLAFRIWGFYYRD